MLKQGTKSVLLKDNQLKHGGLSLSQNDIMGISSIELCAVGEGWPRLVKSFYKPSIENAVFLEEYQDSSNHSTHLIEYAGVGTEDVKQDGIHS